MAKIFDVMMSALPQSLAVLLFLWTLLSSPFAWWISGLVTKQPIIRLLLASISWLAIVLFRIYLFIRLLFKGVMPWIQIHAWGIFVKLVECFVDNKLNTAIMALITIIQDDDDKASDKDTDVGNLVIESHGHFIPEQFVRFLEVLFCVTDADQFCLSALLSLIKDREGSILKGVIKWLKRTNIKTAQKRYVKLGLLVSDKFLEVALERNAVDVAFEIVQLRHIIEDIGEYRVRHNSGKVIANKIATFATQANKVGALMFVLLKSAKPSSPLLLEYKADA